MSGPAWYAGVVRLGRSLSVEEPSSTSASTPPPSGARDGSSFREGNVLSGLVFDGVLVVLALLLVALDGLFVAAEFGLVKVRSTQVDGLVREGKVVVRKESS